MHSRGRVALRSVGTWVRRPYAELWRSALVGKAMRRPGAPVPQRLLVIAPHPDDETLGCGAAIARARAAGAEVRVVVVTDGRFSHRSAVIPPERLAEIRAGECRAACAELDVPADGVTELGLLEGTLWSGLDELTALLAREVAAFRPTDVAVTSGLDWHEDHRAVNAAVRRALASPADPLADPPRAWEYLVWSWADGPWSNRTGRPAWRAGWDLVAEPLRALRASRPVRTGGKAHVAAKRRALSHYKSQTTNLTGEPQWAVMDQRFLALFLRPSEIFLSMDEARA